MPSDRWRRIEGLYHDALVRDPVDRSQFLAEACRGDEALRREVESLLAGDTPTDALVVEQVVTTAQSPNLPESLPIWAWVVIAVAVLRTAVGLVLYLSAAVQFPVPISSTASTNQGLPPWWIYAALSTVFTALGLGLVLGSQGDARAVWLGGVLTLVGAPIASPLIRAAAPVEWLGSLHPDAFVAAFLWTFSGRFPTDLEGRARKSARAVATFSALIGLLCAIANLSAHWPSLASSRWVSPFIAQRRGTIYFLVIYGLAAPVFPMLLWRAYTAHGSARQRVKVFVVGLLLGLVPFSIEVLIEELVPAYKAWAYGPVVGPRIGAVIFGALGIVPFVTAYSVLYDRVVEVRVVLRAAAQYALARYTILCVTLIPFAALAVFLVQHEDERIASLLTGLRPLLLLSFVIFGLVALRLRTRWLDALDRRYFRESYDSRHILTRVVGAMNYSTVDDFVQGIRREMERVLHADTEVFLANETHTALRHYDERLPALSLSSRIVELLMADPRPMEMDLNSPVSLLSRLPAEEQRWLGRGNFRLLVALRRGGGGVEGVLGLATKRSGLPYSDDDRGLIAAVASAASLALDSLKLRSTPVTPIEQPARECLECARLSPFDAARCACGGDLAIANVPHVLRGTFRFEQRIGQGGMGVVYRAVDLSLGREVAIKALPHVTSELIARLRREARAMAAVTHPNLAVIHSVETWHDSPFLVQEFLAGGTLAQRLAGARQPIAEVLDLGITLAEVLQHLHTSGVVHCDIKPSNIGFTQHGLVKLLDFGLATVMRDMRALSGAATMPDGNPDSNAFFMDAAGRWFGTPHFMSPEAVRGETPAPSFDTWALTVVLFEAITGSRPFDGRDKFQILADVVSGRVPDICEIRPDAAPLDQFFRDALAQDIARRPLDAAAMASSLRRLRNRIG